MPESLSEADPSRMNLLDYTGETGDPQGPRGGQQGYRKTDGARYLNKVAVCSPAALFSPPALGADGCWMAGLQSIARSAADT